MDDVSASVENHIQEKDYIYAKTICDTWGYKDSGLSNRKFIWVSEE